MTVCFNSYAQANYFGTAFTWFNERQKKAIPEDIALTTQERDRLENESTSWNPNLGVGVFYDIPLSKGLTGFGFRANLDANFAINLHGFLGGIFKYSFDIGGGIIPYVGLSVNMSYGNTTFIGTGFALGLTLDVSEQNIMYLQLRYDFYDIYLQHMEENEALDSRGYLNLTVGIGFLM